MARKAGMSTGVEVARISVKVGPDTKDFRRELKRDLDRIEQSMRAKIDVEPNLGNFRQEVRAKTKGMRTSVKVDADVDKGFLSRIEKTLTGIEAPSFGGGINPTGWAAIVGGVLAVAAPLMGLLTTSLLTLPGLIAAVAAPIGALTLGMDGLKAAASRLQGPFDQLKQTMSAAVESQFGPVFDRLGKIFPTLSKSLPSVSQGLADLAGSFADTITSGSGMARIESTVKNISTALSNAAPGVGSFTSGLLTLADSLSSKFPALTEWFNTAGKSFSDWVTKMADSGKLDTAFAGLGDTLKVLADTLGGMAKAGMEFFSDPGKVQGFVDVLKGLGTVLVGIVDLSNKLWSTWRTIEQTAVTAFGGMAFAAATAYATISGVFSSIGSTLSGVWNGITTAAQTAWNGVVSAVQTAVSAVQSAVSGVGSFLSGIWNGAVSAAQSAWSSIVSAVSGAVGSVISTVSGMVSQIVSTLASLAQEGINAGRNLVQGLVNGIGGMISSAVAKAKELASSVASAVTGFLGIHSPSKLFTEYGEFVGQGFNDGLKSQMAQLGATARSMAETVSDEFHGGLKFGADGFTTDSSNPLMQAAAGLANAPVDFAKATGKQFLSDLGVSGNGVLSRAASEGINYVFQIGSVDEAMSIKDREESKQALSVVGR